MQNYEWEMEIKIIMTYDMFFSGQVTYQNDFVFLLTFYVKLTLYLRRQKKYFNHSLTQKCCSLLQFTLMQDG